MNKPYQLGICLAGGGARGIAHIGALQALKEANIEPDCVSGSSMGAIVGTLYAAGLEPAAMLKIIKDSDLVKLFKFSLDGGLTDNTYIKDLLQELLPEDDFAALQRPLFVCITNLSRGQYEMVHQGRLTEVVAASASIPILFAPRMIRGDEYVDGGLMNNLPIEPLQERCKHLIGINVTPIMPFPTDENLLEISYRTLDIVLWNTVVSRRLACDVLIEPDTARFHLFELNKADEIYELGYQATKRKLEEIQLLQKP
jgi:NTE family protein